MTKFVIVRHGQSAANLAEVYAGRFDAPLTDLGKRQAALVTDYVLKTYSVDAVYSSPLGRAKETVRAIAERVGTPLLCKEGLSEIYGGKWEQMRFQEIAEKYPQDAVVWMTDIGKARPTGGESFAEVQLRADKAFREIAAENEGKTVVVGVHGGVIRSMQCLFEGQPIERMQQISWVANSSVSEVDFDGKNYLPVYLGYTGHLGSLVTNLAEMK